ncbi:hypothetical protein LJC56_11755 [Christensenellaceae bacterium OttesenSCG-928-K19]|nr:hypothetical protein [Christensenellaceae bacterium OttesenSCG-928-K19]
MIEDKSTGKKAYAIVAEGGAKKNGMGEVSLKAAWDLGYTDASGTSGPTGDFEITVFPGSDVPWPPNDVDTLNAMIVEEGQKWRP